MENREDLALNVYVALCYYKLDYYDVSLELLAVYLQAHPNSAVALNLKACNHFRLYNGKAAAAELRPVLEGGHSAADNDLLRHNMVVFQSGERALQILPPLVGVVPEARLNLVIYHMHNGEVQEAFELMKDIEAEMDAMPQRDYLSHRPLPRLHLLGTAADPESAGPSLALGERVCSVAASGVGATSLSLVTKADG